MNLHLSRDFIVFFILFILHGSEALRKSFQLPSPTTRSLGYTSDESSAKLEELLDQKLSPIRQALTKIESLLDTDDHNTLDSTNDNLNESIKHDSSLDGSNGQQTKDFEEEKPGLYEENSVQQNPTNDFDSRFTQISPHPDERFLQQKLPSSYPGEYQYIHENPLNTWAIQPTWWSSPSYFPSFPASQQNVIRVPENPPTFLPPNLYRSMVPHGVLRGVPTSL